MESADLIDLAVQGYGRGRADEVISRKSLYISPYRKPTQVSGMSILRRVS
jgi:hypothetical protein